MTNKRKALEEKLSYLEKKLRSLGGEELSFPTQQSSFLIEEIDYYKTELLKIEVQEHCKLIDDENN